MEPVGPLADSGIVTRHPRNPILTAAQMPYESELVYNAGVVKRGEGDYAMLFRSDFGPHEPDKKAPFFRIGYATSSEGVEWSVYPSPVITGDGVEIESCYDVRVTPLEGRYYATYAEHTKHGDRAVLAVTDDFVRFETLDKTVPDNRNNVLFPERIGGVYYRLERPFPIYSRDGKERFDIWISESKDLTYWGKSQLLLRVEDVPYANIKVGGGSPPIRTESGWLCLFHAVDEDPGRGQNGWEKEWKRRYSVGVMILDLDNPRKLVACSQKPLMTPTAQYEISGGFRNNVLFPTALVPESGGLVKIYYAAADTVVCLATANLSDLIDHAFGRI